jgi:AcrR family transcriptional regulator
VRRKARVRLDVDERRAQLVELGLAAFGERPYDDVAVEDIARAAGISKGLLFHYFPTKKAFYIACLRESAARLLAKVEEVQADAAPFTQLERSLDAYLEFVQARGRAYATLMRGAGRDREVGAVVDETRRALLASLTSGVAAVFPDATSHRSSLLELALEGWIGLAETTSIAWVERSEEEGAKGLPNARAVRDLLARALVTLVQAAVTPRG